MDTALHQSKWVQLLKTPVAACVLLSVFVFFIAVYTAFEIHVDYIDTFLRTQSDSLGYYQYLPAYFVEDSVTPKNWVIFLDNGQPFSLFSFGVAILQTPFYLIGDVWAGMVGAEQNGFSAPYAYAQFIGAAFYLALSVYLLSRFLLRRYGLAAALFACFCMVFGTNLFYYSAFETGMSHVYNVFIATMLISITQKILDDRKSWGYIVLGAIAGLMVLIKPYNLIALVWFLPWKREAYLEIWQDIKSKVWFPLTGLVVFCFFIYLQIKYWLITAEKPFMFSYGAKGEGFNWGEPELYNVLFSPQNGWFIYSPIMLVSVIGLILMWRKNWWEAAKITLILLVMYYIIASWWAWWFGAAYGHRAFIDIYPFLMIPFAFCLQQLFKLKWQYYLLPVLAMLVLVFGNMKMTFIYMPPWDGPEWGWPQYFEKLSLAFKHLFKLE